jgi:hypothetical protein
VRRFHSWSWDQADGTGGESCGDHHRQGSCLLTKTISICCAARNLILVVAPVDEARQFWEGTSPAVRKKDGDVLPT